LYFLAALSAAAGLALTGTVRADEFDEVKAAESLKAQKALRDVSVLLAEARRAEANNPDRARTLLNQARYRLSEADGLPARDRSALDRQITNALRSVEATVREREAAAKAAAEREALRKREEERRRDLEAQRKQNGSYGKAQGMIETGKGVLSTYDKLRQRKEGAVIAIDRDVQETAANNTPGPRSQALQEWLDRYRPRGVKLTAREKGLLRMLNTTLPVNFENTPLKEAITFVHDKTGIDIFVDESSLKDADIEYDAPVTLKASGLHTRTVLKTVLAGHGLTFIIKEGALHVMTPEKAKQFMIARAYPVADLLPTPNPNLPQAVYRAQAIQSARGLINLITTTMDPAGWQANGGAGTILFNPTSMTLVIRQTAEFHYQMGGFLK
jgi:hypothetical protein